MPSPLLERLNTSLGDQDSTVFMRGPRTAMGVACWYCGAMSGKPSEDQAQPPLEEASVWQSLCRGGMTTTWWSWQRGGREWRCLGRGTQGKEHLLPPLLLSLSLWPVGSTEVGTPTGESQCRPSFGCSREELAGELQWPRALNMFCVWDDSFKISVSTVLGSPVSPDSGTKTLHLLGAGHPVTRSSVMELGLTRVPGLFVALAQIQEWGGSGGHVKGMYWVTEHPDGKKPGPGPMLICPGSRLPSQGHSWFWPTLATREGLKHFEAGNSAD